MHDLFSPAPVAENSILGRLDPRVKLLGAAGAMGAALFARHLILPLGLLVGAITAALFMRIRPRTILHRLAAPLSLALVVGLSQVFLTGSTPLWSGRFAGFHLTATKEGVFSGLLIASRVMACVAIVLLLYLSTPMHQLLAALRWAKFSRRWIEITTLMYRYIFCLLDTASTAMAAQRVRLGYSGVRRSIRSLGQLIGLTTLGALDQADRTFDAMQARGYDGTPHLAPLPALRARSVLILSAFIVFLGLAFVLAEVGL